VANEAMPNARSKEAAIRPESANLLNPRFLGFWSAATAALIAAIFK
jgi:hypothetical protein